MLTRLIIHDFVIIDSIDINFNNGLNIIIGETGSGKSIMFDAIMLLFGEKASPSLIRQGAKKAVVEAYFSFAPDSTILNKLKEDNNFDVDSEEVIIRREIPLKGNSRCFINDTPTTNSMLKEYSKFIVDFHGQNSQQKLFDINSQLLILDSLLENKEIKQQYLEEYNKIQGLIHKYRLLLENKKQALQQQALWEAQLKEINEIDPKLDEDSNLLNELKLLENAEYLTSISNNFLELSDNYDNSSYQNLLGACKILEQLNGIDEIFHSFLDEFESSLISIKETISFVKEYRSNIEFNPSKIEKIRKRLLQLNKLKNKYGQINEILDLQKRLEENLYSVDNFDIDIKKVNDEISNEKIILKNLALVLQKERKKAAKFLESNIKEKLEELYIKDSIFQIVFKYDAADIDEYKGNKYPVIYNDETDEYIKASDKGIDNIEFYISTNKGIKPAPIVDIASGGEISRVMLALKSVIAEADNTPILIFDEIDTGISGRVAQKVGIAMRVLSNYHQILAITHLPQIAALGKHCIVISKQEQNDIITTSAKIVEGNEKLEEIAKLLSGEQLSEAAIESAKELINI